MPQSRLELELLTKAYQQRSRQLGQDYQQAHDHFTVTRDQAQQRWQERLRQLEEQIDAYHSTPPSLYRMTDRMRCRALAQRPFNYYEQMLFARLSWWRRWCLFLIGWLFPALLARETELLRDLRQQSQRRYDAEMRELRQRYHHLQQQAEHDDDVVRSQRSHLMQMKHHITQIQTRELEYAAKLEAATQEAKLPEPHRP